MSLARVADVAKMLDPDAFSECASEHIKWCAGYGYRLDQDMSDWREHHYFGQQFAQRRREAEAKAAAVLEVAARTQEQEPIS